MSNPGREYATDYVRCTRCGCERPLEPPGQHVKWTGPADGYRCVEPGWCDKAKAELERRVGAVKP